MTTSTIPSNTLQKGDLPVSGFIIAGDTQPNTPSHSDSDNDDAIRTQPVITRQLSYNNGHTCLSHKCISCPPRLRRGRSSLADLFKTVVNLQLFTQRLQKPLEPREPAEHIPIPQPTPLTRVISDGKVTEDKQKWLHDEEHISADEHKLIDQLRSKQGDYIAGLSDKECMIFLLSRHMDVDATIVLLKRHIEWRKEINLVEPVQFAQLNRSLVDCGFTYWTHADVFGEDRTVQYFEPAKLKFTGNFTIPELVEHLMWGYEHSVRMFPLSRFRLGFVHVIDLSGIGRKNVPGAGELKQLRNLMSDHFPMRLQYVYIVRSNWYTGILLKCAALVLKDRLMQRIHRVEMDELAHVVPPQFIPTTLGGEWDIEYAQWMAEQNNNDIIHGQTTQSDQSDHQQSGGDTAHTDSTNGSGSSGKQKLASALNRLGGGHH